MMTSSGPGTVSYLAWMPIEPSTIQEPSIERKALFSTVMQKLQLQLFIQPINLVNSGPTSGRLQLPGEDDFDYTKEGWELRRKYEKERTKSEKRKITGMYALIGRCTGS